MRGVNIYFPLVDDKEKNTYFKLTQTTKDALASNLTLLFLTEKGQRYYMPDYGTNIRKFLFEPNDDITRGDIEQDIKTSVRKYIPQLEITDIEFYFGEDKYGNKLSENTIIVEILFQYKENTFSERGRIELTF